MRITLGPTGKLRSMDNQAASYHRHSAAAVMRQGIGPARFAQPLGLRNALRGLVQTWVTHLVHGLMIRISAWQERGAATAYHLSRFFIDSAASAPPPRGISCFSWNLVLFVESIILGNTNRRSLSENRNEPGQLFTKYHLCQPDFEPCPLRKPRFAVIPLSERSFDHQD